MFHVGFHCLADHLARTQDHPTQRAALPVDMLGSGINNDISALRDSGGEVCGVPLAAQIEVTTPGEHTVNFSAREDGFEFDKFVLSTDPDFEPTDAGPGETVGG